MERDKEKSVFIRRVPAKLLREVKAKAMLEDRTLREIVIELFQKYTKKKGG